MLIPPKTVFFEDGDRKDDHTDEYDEDGDYVDKDDEGGGRSKVKLYILFSTLGRSPLKPKSTGMELQQQFDKPCPECPKFTGASKTERMAHLRASHQVD